MKPGKVLNEKIYFPNLNGLRFLAAFLVIVHHVEQFKFHLGLKNCWDVPSIYLIGKLGVILFFVLSGFLITYLLLSEERKTNNISIKDFYIRRMLRIWPLYYFVVFLTLIIIPLISFFDYPGFTEFIYDDFSVKLLLLALFLPNVVNIIFTTLPYLAQAWSVGVEEQFYLIWPWLMKKNQNKKRLLIGVIVIYLLIKVALYYLSYVNADNNYYTALYAFWESFSIDCMAIGGLTAYFLFTKNPVLSFIFKIWVQIAVLLIILTLIIGGITIPYLHYEIYGVLFAILIINLSSNHNRLFTLENRFFDFLGKISFGLYMYHPIAIMISLKLLLNFNIQMLVLQHLLSLGIAIILASISYKYLEQFFIRKKLKFSKIISGDNVKFKTPLFEKLKEKQ